MMLTVKTTLETSENETTLKTSENKSTLETSEVETTLKTSEGLVNFLPDCKESTCSGFGIHSLENFTPNECSWGNLVHSKKCLTKNDDTLKRSSDSAFDVLGDLGEVVEKKVKLHSKRVKRKNYTQNE